MRSFLYLTCFLLIACVTGNHKPAGESEQENSRLLGVSYATGFAIFETEDGYMIEVRDPQDTLEVLSVYHFSRDRKDSTKLHIPLENVVVNSTTFVSYFDRLQSVSRICGVTYGDQIKNEMIQDQLQSGKTQEMIRGEEMDFERLLSLSPEAVLAYSFGSADFSRYEEVGIPVILLMEYKESHPLGRAEWIKVVGCMLDRMDEAYRIFAEVEMAYLEKRNQAALFSTLPSVFTGSKYGDFWYAPGGDSYIARYIKDAGGIYVFDHIEGQGNAELDFESAFMTISEADYWGLVTYSEEPFTRENIVEMNSQYTKLKAFEKDNIFVCNTAETDYFGEAVMEPHLILSDLISILHPRQSQAAGFHYFKPLK